MSIHLVGGGRREDLARAVYGLFLAEAHAVAAGRGRSRARVLIVVVAPTAEAGDQQVDRFTAVLGTAACPDEVAHSAGAAARITAGIDIVPVVVGEQDVLVGVDPECDAILVAGGSTPAYARALAPAADAIRSLIVDGVPYLGFSAGAAIAARRALIGGWRLGDRAVCPPDAAEDLDQVTVAEGLGLVDVSVDVHGAQWGTLGRLVAAAEAGLIGVGVAIDEDTTLVIDLDTAVRGAGQVWTVVKRDPGVHVLVRTAD